MARYRPKTSRSSPYITPQGAVALRAELQQLWRKTRPGVLAALTAAAAEGDRSENAEYTYRKKQLGEIDRRIRYLSKRLDEVKVVSVLPADREKVYFGAMVELRDSGGEVHSYRIVGADEFHQEKDWISVDSPMAQALLGKRRGQRVVVKRPNDEVSYDILKIRYIDP